MPEPPPPKRSPLTLELFGMISKRQLEQHQPAALTQPLATATRSAFKERAPPKRATRPSREMPTPQPATEGLEPQPGPDRVRDVSPSASQPTNDSAATASGNAESMHPQAVRAPDPDANAIRRYLARLSGTIQSHLTYPLQARRAGLDGAPVIRFTVTEAGAILEGSLVLLRSSGVPALDENALQAALQSVPLPAPPRRMDVSLVISFAQERLMNSH